MNVFGTYARYYDLLYQDKNYREEAAYVHRLVQHYAPNARTILELGCGTGAHASFLAGFGYELHGVDRSADMLDRARHSLSEMRPEDARRLAFSSGDVRSFRLAQRFDAVISLFHVMSYQVKNEDLTASFATARAHLNPGGIFIFDCWYGPGVLTERPSPRTKRLENEEISVVRFAEPVMHPRDNLVDVNYRILVEDKKTRQVEELEETHRMRYLFEPEIDYFLSGSGLERIHAAEWMSDKKPGFDTWNVCFVARS